MATPITSLFTAAYIVQFLDLARTIITSAKTVYKAPSSPIAPQSEPENRPVSKYLQELALKLKTPDVPAGPGPFGSRNECANDFRLAKICKDCREVEVRLRPYMSDVKKEGSEEHGGAGKWGKFKKALKDVGSKQDLDDLAKKLADLRDQNDWHVLALLKKLDGPNVILDDERFKALDSERKMVISGWLEQREVSWSAKGAQGPRSESDYILLNW